MIETGSLAAMRATLAAATDAPLIVAIGGDGSVREAAETMANGVAHLAIVPAGTGNVLAGSLGIRGIGPALDAIRSGSPRRLDLGRARWGPTAGTPGTDPATATAAAERIFIVACGMGLDARIMAAAETEWKRRLRFGAYVGAAIREMGRLAPSRFRIVADGDAMEIDGYLAMVANAGHRPRWHGPTGRAAGRSPAPARDRRAARRRHPALHQPRHHRGRTRAADRDRRRPPPRRAPRGRGGTRRRHRPGAALMWRSGADIGAVAAC
jgi:diacylglycerol kinase family enzyme